MHRHQGLEGYTHTWHLIGSCLVFVSAEWVLFQWLIPSKHKHQELQVQVNKPASCYGSGQQGFSFILLHCINLNHSRYSGIYTRK